MRLWIRNLLLALSRAFARGADQVAPPAPQLTDHDRAFLDHQFEEVFARSLSLGVLTPDILGRHNGFTFRVKEEHPRDWALVAPGRFIPVIDIYADMRARTYSQFRAEFPSAPDLLPQIRQLNEDAELRQNLSVALSEL